MAVTDKELAVIKALTKAPLNLEEVKILFDADVRDIMTENELDYFQAEQVKSWVEQESYRHRSQHLQTPVEDYDLPLSGEPSYRLPQGDFVLPLKESPLKRKIRRLIKKHTS